jgi:hypothetical protein
MALKLENPTIDVEHTDGKVYTLADPIAFVLSLIEKGLLQSTGKPAEGPKTMGDLRQEVIDAFGFPSLTFAQLIQILTAIGEFADGFQKKTPSTPISPNATDSSRKRMPTG